MALFDFVYQVLNIRNGLFEDIYLSSMKCFHDPSLDSEDNMSHVVYFDTGMPFQRFMRLVESNDGLIVQRCLKALEESEGTPESIIKVNVDVP